MRKGSLISFGPGAASLILIVVILSMSVLGMLALMSARSDMNLTRRSAQVVEAVYELNAAAERRLAELDATVAKLREQAQDDQALLALLAAQLPAGLKLDGQTVSWTEEDELRRLSCAAEVLPMSSARRLQWREHSLTAMTEEIWN